MTRRARLWLGFCAALLIAGIASAQEIDWTRARDQAVATLRDYIRLNTTNPPGDVSRTADFLTGLLQREGVPVTRYESAPGKVIVTARLKGMGQARPILLLHHMDVVPADASRWKVNPFGAALIDGEVWGRGAVDMKGPGVAQLFAFLGLKRQRIPLIRDVILMAVPDEEVGGELGARWMIEHHFDELNPEYVLDEGGFGSRDLFAKGKLVYSVAVTEKKVLWLKVVAEGVAGHGSQPHDQNPNDKLARALARLLSQPLPGGAVPALDALRSAVGALASNKFTNAIQHSTIAITSLRSGVGDPPKVNVIPSIAEATLDCRLLPGTKTADWLQEVRRRLGDSELKLEVIYESPDPVASDPSTPLFRALATAIKRRHPEAIVSPILIPYGTDSSHFRQRGVTSYGLFPAVLSAEIADSTHSDAERLPVNELGDAIQILYEALREVAGRPR